MKLTFSYIFDSIKIRKEKIEKQIRGEWSILRNLLAGKYPTNKNQISIRDKNLNVYRNFTFNNIYHVKLSMNSKSHANK